MAEKSCLRVDVLAGYFPVPVNVTFCGDPPPLSLMSSDALRVPFALGVKVTAIVQLRPAARLEPQLLVCAKSVALGPLMAKPEKVSVVPPALVSATFEGGGVVPTFCGGKISEVGERLTSVPTPNKVRICVGGPALSLMGTDPMRLPITAGLNLTVMVQEPPTATLLPQVFVWPKLPLAARLVIVSGLVPVLARITVCGPLTVPPTFLPNFRPVL